jgi:hypothetical protein
MQTMCCVLLMRGLNKGEGHRCRYTLERAVRFDIGRVNISLTLWPSFPFEIESPPSVSSTLVYALFLSGN